jgi:hypothetical protein
MDMAHDDEMHYKKNDPEYNNPDKGRCTCRICHFLQHVEIGNMAWTQKTAQRIWDSGLRHFSVYQKSGIDVRYGVPRLLVQDRQQFRELLLGLQLDADILIDTNISRPYVYKGDNGYGKR